MRRVQISKETAAWIAQALRESQAEKEEHHRESLHRLARRRDHLQDNLDRAYEHLLDGTITKRQWARKRQEWESELERTVTELGKLDRASNNYLATGTKILELSQKAYALYVSQERTEQRRLPKHSPIELHLRSRNCHACIQ